MRASITAALLCMAASGPGTAHAQADRDVEARALFEAARAAYHAGHYEDALARFRDAHRLSGRSALLYNIGHVADRLRMDETAIEAYEGYLETAPADSPNRALAEGRLAFLLEHRVPADDAEAPSPEQAAASIEDVADAGLDDPVVLEDPPSDGADPWPWVGVGAGVAIAAGVGIALGLVLGGGSASYADSDLGHTVLTLGAWQ